jgi:hypothetical protein
MLNTITVQFSTAVFSAVMDLSIKKSNKTLPKSKKEVIILNVTVGGGRKGVRRCLELAVQ